MVKYNNRSISALILLCIVVITCFACLFAYLLTPDIPAFPILAANIGALVFIYTLLRFRQSRKLNKSLIEVSWMLTTIADDLNADFHLVNKDPQLEGFVKQVELFRERLKTKEENRQQIFNLVDSIAVNIEIEKLLDDLMPKLLEVSDSNCIAFYIANSITNRLEIKSSLGFNKNLYSEFDLMIGEGMIGSAVKSKETKIIRNIPEDTVYSTRTILGKIKPKCLMIVPVFNQEQLLGTLVLTTIYDYTQAQLEMVDLMKYYIGVAVSNGLAYEKTIRLSNELKFQNKLIQGLNDELEKSARQRTGLMHEVLDSIKSEAIYALDSDCRILAWNTGAEEQLGYMADKVIGRHVDSIFSEEVLKDGSVRGLYERAAKNGMSAAGFKRRKDGGKEIFVEMRVFTRYDENGVPSGFTTVARDITSLTELWIFKLEEDAIDRLMQLGNQAILYTDAGGRIIRAGVAAEQMLGADGTQLKGRHIGDFFDDANELEKRMEMLCYAPYAERRRYRLRNGLEADLSLCAVLTPGTYEKMFIAQLFEAGGEGLK